MEIDTLKKPRRFFSRKAVVVALFFGVIGLSLCVVSCEEYEPEIIPPPVIVCDVLNPLTDLPWLKEIVRTVDSGFSLCHWIYQCNYNDTVGFLLVNAPTFRAYNLINCEGEIVCSQGYHSGCKDIAVDFNSRKLLWLDTAFLFVDNPLSADSPLLSWLKKYVEDCPKQCNTTVKIYQCNYRDGVGFVFDYVDLGYYILWNIVGDVDWDSRQTPWCDWEIDHRNKVLIWEYIKE